MKKKILIVLVIFFGFVLIFSFFIISTILVLFLYTNNNKEESKNYTYQLSNLNPSSNNMNKTNIGFVKIRNNLKEDEFLSYYNNKVQVTSIMSNFFDEEFECTGLCSCEEVNERRNIAPIIFKRGLFIIFSALSVSMAYNIAKESFQNDCENQLISVCAKNKIKSEVSGCISTEIEAVRTFQELKEEDEPKQQRNYFCEGYCLQNKRHMKKDTHELDSLRGESLKELKLSFGDCTTLETSGTIEVIINPDNVKEHQRSNFHARNKFTTRYLTPFCKHNSLVKVKVQLSRKDDTTLAVDYIWTKGKLGDTKHSGQGVYFKENQVPACTSQQFGKMYYKNIKCKLMSKSFV